MMNNKIKRLEDVLAMMGTHATDVMLLIPPKTLNEMPSHFKNYPKMLVDHIKLMIQKSLSISKLKKLRKL